MIILELENIVKGWNKLNILDVKKEEVEKVLKKLDTVDTFELFLKMGNEYMKKYRTSPVDINTREGQTEFRRIAWYTTEELCEMVNLLKIREWSKTEYPVDKLHFMEELADFFNFVIQIILILDLDKKKLKDLLVRKFVVNDFRLNSNYWNEAK